MTSFGVDTDVMASAAAKVGLAVEQIDDLITKMRNDVDDMLAGWSSAGADAHSALHERYQNDVNTVNNALRSFQEGLERTRLLYVTQETEQHSDHVVMSNQILS